MSLSNRHRQILELLMKQRDDITAGEIAAEINVSTRTVHRELSELETVLGNLGIALRKKSGKGIQLLAEPEKLEALRYLLDGRVNVAYSAEERRMLLLCLLLQEEEPVKLFTLSHELAVTIPTITNDLDELDSWVNRSNLTLVRKRGYGVELSGTEANKRRMILHLARNGLDESDLFGKNESQHSPLAQKLLKLIGKENFTKVEEALWLAEDEGLSEISEEEYTNLLISLSITIARIQMGRPIEANSDHHSARPSKLLTHTIDHLTEEIPIQLTAAEISYIAELLEPTSEPHANLLLPIDELSYMEMVWKLIRRMERNLGVPFSDDRSLKDGLLSHLESAIKRLLAGATIRNPLLTQIKKDYEVLFEAIREAVNTTISEIAIPDEEIGFLVMHFGASIERQKQFKRNVRAILVCTSGIGTSKMLAVRLTKELPQINIIGNASWFEAARIPKKDYDLIISTVDLPLPSDQYMKLSPLLTKDEAERLRLFIQNVTLQKESGEPIPMHLEAGSRDRLHRIQFYINEIVSIIDQFTVFHIEQSYEDLEEALQDICSYVSRAGVFDDVKPIVELLLAREKLSSQVIPDTGLALFHIRSEQVKKPSFTLFRLADDLPLESGKKSGVRQMLLMLGPQELSKESLEVLSEISSFLLIPEMIELLRSGSQSEIKHFLSQELAAFLENKK
ncbi:BglG family transcription antiterminator [Paenibacillus chondroitinus]|uniref:BglG family transcription antiterminator n=1 Tax=Paenibacillus chondroitinus TaxID=59842 RepID=A0ABU6D9V8_9BACL|nr:MULTISPECIES: BglG family transcription antiterminator [Paenibacillus]MCY9656617.1 BglG family transcription antiterminator [Paenibacillus anseongense]MEB4794266.1 BglG family transcription antiterminator [Paenibacillus chondroitinus]